MKPSIGYVSLHQEVWINFPIWFNSWRNLKSFLKLQRILVRANLRNGQLWDLLLLGDISTMSSKPILGYWDIRAFAQPMRYMLKYAGVDFVDKRYQFGEGKTLAEMESIRKHWMPVKFTLGLDFPNLPYYIDGDIKVSII